MKFPRLKRAAAIDAAEAAEYLSRDNHAIGVAFKQAVARTLETIRKSPRRYARLETNRTDREIRRAILHRFRYLIIYEVQRDQPVVLAVMHASRQPDYWQTREDS